MNWKGTLGTAFFIALSLSAVKALACPGCTLPYVWNYNPELGFYNHILGIWITLLIVNWSLSELNYPYPKLRGVVTGSLLSTCTPDLFFFSYGLLLGIPLLALNISIARREVPEVPHKYFFECVFLGWFVGIIATIGMNIIVFMLGFVLILILCIAYFKLTNERRNNFWRIVIIVAVLLGPWLCFPVTVLNAAYFFSEFRHNDLPRLSGAIDRYSLPIFLRSIHLVMGAPLVVSVGALIFRNYIEMNKLTRLVIAVGMWATPLAIAILIISKYYYRV